MGLRAFELLEHFHAVSGTLSLSYFLSSETLWDLYFPHLTLKKTETYINLPNISKANKGFFFDTKVQISSNLTYENEKIFFSFTCYSETIFFRHVCKKVTWHRLNCHHKQKWEGRRNIPNRSLWSNYFLLVLHAYSNYSLKV